MKVVILAGGLGTRLSEETSVRPKPMVEIGGKPILWHIMRIYYAHGIREFIICCGYKGYIIKEYFSNYWLHVSDVTFDASNNGITIHNNNAEDWRITLVDTGEDTLTGGRIKRVREYIGDETFFLTYGDGVGNIDISASLRFHRTQGVYATLTAVQPPGRFGAFALQGGRTKIEHFREKPIGDDAWVNGGYFVVEPDVMEYIEGDQSTWEREPMQRLAADGQLSAYRHFGFWQSMDTLRDRHVLEELWKSGNAPWMIW
jgi:glucose-1-phosphate cytidylyltransferase